MDFLKGKVGPIYFKYLPAVAGAGSIWLAMPITELAVAVSVVTNIRRCTRALPYGPAC